MDALRPNGQRARNAINLIWIVLAVEVMSLISGFFQYDLLRTAASGAIVSMGTASANDTREQILGVLYMIVFIFSAIAFIQWFRRAYYNLHLKVNRLSHTEGWAAGSWFVPIINFYRPYQIMKELYTETQALFTRNGVAFSKTFSTNALVWWWALWLISNFFAQFTLRYALRAETIDELMTSTIANIIGNILGIPLALITIKVIKDYSNVESLLSELKCEDESTTD